jgi:hypothetical protein
MRKTKTPRRSRLIRKWDGTPVGSTEPETSAIPDVESEVRSRPSHTLQHPELFFEMNPEDELTDTLDN